MLWLRGMIVSRDWQKNSVCPIQCIHTTHPYNTSLQYIPAIQSYNAFLQYILITTAIQQQVQILMHALSCMLEALHVHAQSELQLQRTRVDA